jgi:AbrB family looped-hinge helix DNA binding protein
MIVRPKMTNVNKPCTGRLDEAFYGSATLGERGQVVIPAEARAELGLNPGDKVLIMRHPIHRGLQMFKLDAVKEFLDDFATGIAVIESRMEEDPAE